MLTISNDRSGNALHKRFALAPIASPESLGSRWIAVGAVGGERLNNRISVVGVPCVQVLFCYVQVKARPARADRQGLRRKSRVDSLLSFPGTRTAMVTGEPTHGRDSAILARLQGFAATRGGRLAIS